jgi:hypothetical protein
MRSLKITRQPRSRLLNWTAIFVFTVAEKHRPPGQPSHFHRNQWWHCSLLGICTSFLVSGSGKMNARDSCKAAGDHLGEKISSLSPRGRCPLGQSANRPHSVGQTPPATEPLCVARNSGCAFQTSKKREQLPSESDPGSWEFPFSLLEPFSLHSPRPGGSPVPETSLGENCHFASPLLLPVPFNLHPQRSHLFLAVRWRLH